MSAPNSAAGWVSRSIVELVSVTMTGMLLVIPAYSDSSLRRVDMIPEMSVGSVSMAAVLDPPG